MPEIKSNLDENLAILQEKCGQSRELKISLYEYKTARLAFLSVENMINQAQYNDITRAVLLAVEQSEPGGAYAAVKRRIVLSPDSEEHTGFQTLLPLIFSGHMAILVDGANTALTAAVQGFELRSIQPPTTEVNLYGAKESFVESVKMNQTMIRRRIKSADLRFETLQMGSLSQTACVIAYIDNIVDKSLLTEVRKRLTGAKLEMVADSGSIRMLLGDRTWSAVADTGLTERPDIACAKVYEGRVLVLVDGTPHAIIIPYLFVDHFDSIDDHQTKTSFSVFIRVCRYIAFFFAVVFPGLHVAVISIHPEIMPRPLLLTVVVAQKSVPFPLFVEMIILMLVYEMMREAGLKMPREIGSAVSIVGALVIGEAAAAAGIIGTTTILVAAVAGLTTFVVPTLAESCIIFRFSLVILGGTLGLVGLVLGCMVILAMAARTTSYGVPLSSGFSPTNLNTFIVKAFKGVRQSTASPDTPKIQDMPGAEDMRGRDDTTAGND